MYDNNEELENEEETTSGNGSFLSNFYNNNKKLIWILIGVIVIIILLSILSKGKGNQPNNPSEKQLKVVITDYNNKNIEKGEITPDSSIRLKATIDGILNVDEIYKLKDGIVIDGIKVIPTRVKVKKKNLNKNKQIVELSIVEGRNHIVKRIFESIGHPVIKLKRIRYGNLNVDDLRYGEYRELSLKEVKELYALKK